jgi:hypothetical protein
MNGTEKGSARHIEKNRAIPRFMTIESVVIMESILSQYKMSFCRVFEHFTY